MYEKPQYMTPGGFKRNQRNPSTQSTKKLIVEQKARLVKRGMDLKQISPETAKLIAMAIKGLLKQ